jgi:hypothetical protein
MVQLDHYARLHSQTWEQQVDATALVLHIPFGVVVTFALAQGSGRSETAKFAKVGRPPLSRMQESP